MKKFVLLFFCMLSLVLPVDQVYARSLASLLGEPDINFIRAKRELRKLYIRNPSWRRTIYCDVAFSEKFVLDLPKGFAYPMDLATRAQRIEWEHVVPAENFGRHFREWREGIPECMGERGRACARKNANFAAMEGDMHNLYPSVGAVNAMRSNFRYEPLRTGTQPFGTCPVRISGRMFSPPEYARGIVARASLYMAHRYQNITPNLFSPNQMRLFEAWDREYPPTQYECERNIAIARVQKNDNPFITRACKK